ncbi:hypothetical protein [Altererythrobacter aquiaggeris]|uniref:hypothetical protein n=1 Tax=Aestuarierythrobacter aquiaggeris TaxID=1898396 RepID=UPI00301747A6
MRLSDDAFLLDLIGDAVCDPGTLQSVRQQGDLTSAQLRSGSAATKAELLAAILSAVRLDEQAIEVELSAAGITQALDLKSKGPLRDLPAIFIPAVRSRSGHQLKLVVLGAGHAETPPARHDGKLIALLAEALDARDLVFAIPDVSMNALAKREGRCRTRLARLVGISCLAPELIKQVVEGKQTNELTAEVLQSAPLPAAWADQLSKWG